MTLQPETDPATRAAAFPTGPAGDPLATLRLAEQLIAQPSNTPDDAGCMDIIAARLQPLGFEMHWIDSGPETFRVRNLWAKRTAVAAQNIPKIDASKPHFAGESIDKLAINSVANNMATTAKTNPTLAFAGHTDVVPTGPLAQWTSPPFVPTHRDGKLYGRGASDMKTSLAAMVVAVEEFVAAQPAAPLNIAFLLTSDEEGPALDGTVKVCQWLKERGQAPDFCIVGEPTSVLRTGDMIKNGRRGTLGGKLTIHGIQGHIAYPQLAKNPIHLAAPALAALVATVWDNGNAYYLPTSWQISNIHSGTGASNVIPGSMVVDFNFRFCTESTPENLQQRVHAILQAHGLQAPDGSDQDNQKGDYSLVWTLGGLPFLTPVELPAEAADPLGASRPAPLIAAVRAAILAETGLTTELSTTGGTSDGRFIAQICPQTIELGPPNATIHKINEHVVVADIEPLKNIYRRVLENLAAL